MNNLRAQDAHALRDLLRQSEISGASRRAVLLHTDRLPSDLARPHHVRLAREALNSLTMADRAQLFELSHGRIAIVWRSKGGAELAHAKEALSHLLADQPAGRSLEVGQILTQYDLPDQAVWLLDELAETPVESATAPASAPPIDVKMLARLEAGLAQADLSPYARWRAVRHLPDAWPAPKGWRLDHSLAWEERLFAVHELAEGLCPGHNIKADAWLFRRLTRVLDSRMLAMLSAPREDRGSGAFAIHVNVATILSQDFLRFDEALKLALRGQVILFLRPADILADPSSYAFARNFALARSYRLGVAGITFPVLRFLDVESLGVDIVQIALTPELQSGHAELRSLVPPDCELVLTGIDRPSDLRWAVQHGFTHGRGKAFTL